MPDDTISGDKRSGNSSTIKVNPFSHPRTVIHQFEYAELLIRFLVKRLVTGWWLSLKTAYFQLDYSPEGGLTDIEKRALVDSLVHSGFKNVYILKQNAAETKITELHQELREKRFLGSDRVKKINPVLKSMILAYVNSKYDGGFDKLRN